MQMFVIFSGENNRSDLDFFQVVQNFCVSVEGIFFNFFLPKQIQFLRLSLGLLELFFIAASVHIKSYLFSLFWGLRFHCDSFLSKDDSTLSSWHCSVCCAAFYLTGILSCIIFSAKLKGASSGCSLLFLHCFCWVQVTWAFH